MRQVGLDHVRIPVDPVVFGWRPDAGAARLAFLPSLRQAIETALTAGLEVVLDLHTTAETKSRIEQEPALEQALVSLWLQLGRALADLPTSRLAFELFNEPQYYGWQARRWPALQTRLLAAVREQAPRHLVLLTGNEGGSFKGLQGLPRVSDAAVAYVFHYYEPFLFTHQGAHWLDTRYTTAGTAQQHSVPAVCAGRRQPGVEPVSLPRGSRARRVPFRSMGCRPRARRLRTRPGPTQGSMAFACCAMNSASSARGWTRLRDIDGWPMCAGPWKPRASAGRCGTTATSSASPTPPRSRLEAAFARSKPAALQALGLDAATARR